MATIKSSIELYDAFTAPMMDIIQAVNMGLSAMENLQQGMNQSVDTTSIDGARDALNQADDLAGKEHRQQRTGEALQRQIRRGQREDDQIAAQIDALNRLAKHLVQFRFNGSLKTLNLSYLPAQRDSNRKSRVQTA